MSTTISLPVQQPAPSVPSAAVRIALVGNPNCGKTTLFNRLTGLRAKTSNFPGTTLECRTGRLGQVAGAIDLVDMPGLYSSRFPQAEERLAVDALRGEMPGFDPPDAAVVVVDATCLSRHLYLASEVRQMGVPMLVALTMMDEARRAGLTLCLDTLARELDAPVIPVSGRTGQGVEALRQAVGDLAADPAPREHEHQRARAMTHRLSCAACTGCPHTDRHTWACGVSARAGLGREDPGVAANPRTDAIDRVLTHPLAGALAFALIMVAVFTLIFQVAAYPMDWIDGGFGAMSDAVASAAPDGLVSSFLTDGLLAGLAGVVVFLPQIVLLFFSLTLLEDTGYLARAAFVADRLMQKVGLPGKAFIPMLSAHACAIPAILSAKVIESRRDRLITILVLPLMTCSARLPVYAMVTALLFGDSPLRAGLVFFGAYALGIVAAMAASLVLGRTILKGQPQPLLIELPPYRWPSLRTACLSAYDRGRSFLFKAGRVIFPLFVVLWAAASFPQLPADRLPEVAPPAVAAAIERGEVTGEALDNLHARLALEQSVAGRLGRLVEPVFEPLGFDWRIDIGIMTSFAAREVVVSTIAVVAGVGEGAAEESPTLIQSLRRMTRDDGSPLLDVPTTLSLLVFFVLAMQCLPTQVVTRRETGSWRWAALQFTYMTVLAYAAAAVTYQLAAALGA